VPIALTRAVSRSIAECQLTHVARLLIDVARARAQHEQYEQALERSGCTVVRVAELPDAPDAVFVEDTAIVLDEVAVLMRPGAEPRRQEVESMAAALAAYRPILRITEPGTLDGGDVLRLGRTLYVGLTSRTNDTGIEQLRAAVAPYGYAVRGVPVSGALHLKTAVTQVSAAQILVNPDWVDPSTFEGFIPIAIDPDEPFSANAVLLDTGVIHSTAFPRTQAVLVRHGIPVIGVDASELAKAEGGVTCCSLLVNVDPLAVNAGATKRGLA
jgi:dimethylargininase